MGRATRWLRGLLGLKKDKDHKDNSNADDRKDKRRWSFGKSGRDAVSMSQIPAIIPPNVPSVDAAWLRSYYSLTKKEQNKHAIVVVAATAAAADAVVAAAQAAAAVVRLTSQGKGMTFGGRRENLAA